MSRCTTLCPQQFVLAHLANEQVPSVKTDSFLWCHDPYTLACKARPSFDGCGTSLSVSLSLSMILFEKGLSPSLLCVVLLSSASLRWCCRSPLCFFLFLENVVLFLGSFFSFNFFC